MKCPTAFLILLSGSLLVSNGAFATDACRALVDVGSCVAATELAEDTSGSIGSLSDIRGRVLASGEEGFTPVQSDMRLRVGDRVILTEGSRATLRAGAFFDQKIASPTIVDAVAVGNCGCLTVQSNTRTFAQASEGADGSGAVAGGEVAGPAGVPIPPTPVIVGAVGLGAVGIGVAAAASNDDDEPASP